MQNSGEPCLARVGPTQRRWDVPWESCHGHVCPNTSA